MAFDRAQIMTAAWAAHRSLPAGTLVGMSKRDRQCRFKNCLRNAWRDAKTAAQEPVEQSPIDRLKAQIQSLENTDTLGQEGIAELRKLEAKLVALRAEERREATRAKRDLITATEGRFASVTFIKADGSLRQMRVQPASLKFHVKGDAATDAGRKGAETRAARHPHLLPVWDTDKKAIRSVNLETVTRIAVGGEVHEYAA